MKWNIITLLFASIQLSQGASMVDLERDVIELDAPATA